LLLLSRCLTLRAPEPLLCRIEPFDHSVQSLLLQLQSPERQLTAGAARNHHLYGGPQRVNFISA
jgi:hypothetical protein